MRSFANKVVIRPIRGKDLGQLFDIIQRSFKREIEIEGLDLQRFSRSIKFYRAVEFLVPIFNFLHMDFPMVLVAETHDKVVGEVHLVPYRKGIWTIDSLAVDPKYAGLGIGFNLIKGSLGYISKRQGKRVLSSIRTENVPALKIAEKLGFKVFGKRNTLFLEMQAPPAPHLDDNIRLREVHPADVQQVYHICNNLDPTRVRAYDMSSETFLDPITSRFINAMIKSHSKRFVIEVDNCITGYVHINFTSKQEAARIESFYLLSISSFSKHANMMLTQALNYLAKKNIKTVIASLSEGHKETIEAFRRIGFESLASFYEIMKCLN